VEREKRTSCKLCKTCKVPFPFDLDLQKIQVFSLGTLYMLSRNLESIQAQRQAEKPKENIVLRIRLNSFLPITPEAELK